MMISCNTHHGGHMPGSVAHCRGWSLAVTTAAVIHAAPHIQQCVRPALISSAAAADLSGAVQQSFHIPQRMFTLEHPQIDPRCASAHFKPHPTTLAVALPGAPTQDLVWLTQSNCVLLEATEPLHLSATDMHSIDALKLCRGTGMCSMPGSNKYYIILIILRQCVTISWRCGNVSKETDMFTFLAAFVVKRLVADSVAWHKGSRKKLCYT